MHRREFSLSAAALATATWGGGMTLSSLAHAQGKNPQEGTDFLLLDKPAPTESGAGTPAPQGARLELLHVRKRGLLAKRRAVANPQHAKQDQEKSESIVVATERGDANHHQTNQRLQPSDCELFVVAPMHQHKRVDESHKDGSDNVCPAHERHQALQVEHVGQVLRAVDDDAVVVVVDEAEE